METRKVTAIKCGTLIDGTGSNPQKDKTLLMEGCRVTKIVDGLINLKDSRVIDASNKTVMPGMIDAHIHLASVVGVASEPEYAILKTPEPLLLLHAVPLIPSP